MMKRPPLPSPLLQRRRGGTTNGLTANRGQRSSTELRAWSLSWVVLQAWLAATCLSSVALFAGEHQAVRQVGVARIDITPGYSIRLTGYAVRKTESEGVAQRLWAKALAIGSDQEHPAILVTVDNCGVPAGIRDEVTARLKKGVRESISGVG